MKLIKPTGQESGTSRQELRNHRTGKKGKVRQSVVGFLPVVTFRGACTPHQKGPEISSRSASFMIIGLLDEILEGFLYSSAVRDASFLHVVGVLD